MGSSNQKEKNAIINPKFSPIKSIDICVKLNKFNDKPNYLFSEDWNVFHLDSTLKEISNGNREELFYLLYDNYKRMLSDNIELIHEINFIESIKTENKAISLYEIQNQNLFDLKDFSDLILSDPEKNKSIWYKISEENISNFSEDIEIVKIHYDKDLSDLKNYNMTLREYLKMKYNKIFDSNIKYIFFMEIEKQDSINMTQKYRDLINSNLEKKKSYKL